MHMQALRFRAGAFVAGVALLAFSGWASADPPSRVARLGYASGAVSLSPAGERDWDQAVLNRPLGAGDRLWTEPRARAEVQVGGAMVRLDAETGISILNLDDRITQLQLTQGVLNVSVRRLERNQAFEVDTPNLAFTLRQPGDYRIEVDPQDDATTIFMRQGQGEAFGDGAAYVIDARQPYRFMGTGLRDYELVDAARPDDFDRWANARDRLFERSASARYVSPDVVGYQDLDANGNWRVDANYGNVWVPNRVAAGWAPYRDGHWAWVDPWGWTWVDDAPWGFAVSHYGRWANMRGTWGWVPGPVHTRAYYAPALVAFVGGNNFQLTIASGNVGGVGWFPLAPREIYRPSYPVSRGYFENINRSNTVINTTVINNTYKTYNTTNVTQVVYANRAVPGAVVAMPTSAFVQSQPVSRSAVRISRDLLARAAVATVAPVAPTDRSVHGAGDRGERPPGRVFERPVVVRTVPAAPHVGFAAQREQLGARPGRPLDDSARRELRASTTAPAPLVRVVVPPPATAPALRLPPAQRGAERDVSRDRPERPERRSQPAAPVMQGAPATPPVVVVPPLMPAPAARPAEPAARERGERGRRVEQDRREEQGRRDEQRGQRPAPSPVTPVPAVVAPVVVVPPAVIAAPVVPAPPRGERPEQGRREEQGRRDEQRGQRPAPPPVPALPAPVVAAPPPVIAVPAAVAPRAQPMAPRPQPAASRPGEREPERGRHRRAEEERRQGG